MRPDPDNPTFLDALAGEAGRAWQALAWIGWALLMFLLSLAIYTVLS